MTGRTATPCPYREQDSRAVVWTCFHDADHEPQAHRLVRVKGRVASGNSTTHEGENDWCECPATSRKHFRREGICPDLTGRTPSWDEPILVRTLHPDDGYRCGVAHDCDEPAEWSVELVGLDSREEEPEDDAPHADACMAHVGWVMGALLPKVNP